ncbi:cytochrome P450, partial [archaeon]
MLSYVSCGVILVLGYLAWWWISVTSSVEPGVANTIGYPLVGNALDFLPHKLLGSLEYYRKKFGSLVLVRIFFQRVFIVADPQVAREVLMKRPKQFRRSRQSLYTGKVSNVNLSLLHAHGLLWSRLRRSTAPSFSTMNVANKVDIIVDELRSWIGRLKTASQNPHHPVDMTTEAFTLTTRVISRVAFGLDPENPVIAYFFSPMFIDDMKAVLDYTLEFTFRRLPVWLWKISPWYHFERRVVKTDQRLTTQCQAVLDYKRALNTRNNNINPSNQSSTGMIDVLIQKNEKDNTEGGGGMTDEEIIHNIKIFYFAGTDTTGITISWLTYFLSLHPAVQEKVRNEVCSVLFAHAYIDYTQTKACTYTHAVVKETMRLRNAASMLILEPEDNLDSVVLSSGLVLKQGDAVWVYIDGVLWNEDIFPNPSEFLPDRWLPEHTEAGQLS